MIHDLHKLHLIFVDNSDYYLSLPNNLQASATLIVKTIFIIINTVKTYFNINHLKLIAL